MSGLEVIGVLLSILGPVEQGITITQRMKLRVQSYKDNVQTIESLEKLLLDNKSNIRQLSDKLNICYGQLPSQNRSMFDQSMEKVQTEINKAYQSLLRLQKLTNRSQFHRFITATSVATECGRLMQRLENANGILVQQNGFLTGIVVNMSITNTQTMHIQNSMEEQQRKLVAQLAKTHISLQKPIIAQFQPQIQVRACSEAAKSDFETEDTEGNRITVEGRIKAALLNSHVTKRCVFAIQGEAGVGKTTILNMLSQEVELQNHFNDGIYCMTFGANANDGYAIHQIHSIFRSSGGSVPRKGRRKWNTFEKAIDDTSQWFQNKRFLLLVDDVWDRIDSRVQLIQGLSRMIVSGKNAALIYTTRDADIALHGKVFKMRRRVPLGKESRSILMRHAQCLEETQFKPSAETAIKTILTRSAGLPVALAVVGKAVAAYSLTSTTEIEDVWEWYVLSQQNILQSHTPGYNSLHSIFTTALNVLEQRSPKVSQRSSSGNSETSYSAMHRALCVLKKQQWAPLHLLVRLWNIDDDEKSAKDICKEFVRVGLVEWRSENLDDGRLMTGIAVHDLLHDFVTEEAEKRDEVHLWHRQVVAGYANRASLVSDHGCRAWWEIGTEDGGYILKNLSRHLFMGWLTNTELVTLTTRPNWIAKQLTINGIRQYEKDVRFALQELNWATCDIMENAKVTYRNAVLDYELDVRDIKMILNAAKLSMSMISRNPREVWFQLYDRLLQVPQTSTNLNKYLSYILFQSPRPWMRPLSGCLTGVEGSIQGLTLVGRFINCFYVLPGDREVVCGCDHGIMIIVHVRENAIKREWKAHDADIITMSSRKNGKLLVTGSTDMTAKIWDVGVWNQVEKTVCCHHDVVCSVAINHDDSMIFTASDDGSICSWNTDSIDRGGTTIQREKRECLWIGALQNGNLLLKFRKDGVEYLQKLQLQEHMNNSNNSDQQFNSDTTSITPIRVESNIRCIELSESGTKLIAGCQDGSVRIWDTDSMKQLTTLNEKSILKIDCVSLNSDGTNFAIACVDGTISVRRTKDNEQLFENSTNKLLYLKNIQFMGKGDKLVACSIDGTVWVCKLNSLRCSMKREDIIAKRGTCVAHISGRAQFLTGHWDGCLRIWDEKSGKMCGRPIKVHNDIVTSISVSSNEKQVGSVSDDQRLSIVDLDNVNHVRSIDIGYSKPLESVELSPDGFRAVTVSVDQTIWIWDLVKFDGSHSTISQRRVRGDADASAWFAADGKRIIYYSSYRTSVWDVDTLSLQTESVNQINTYITVLDSFSRKQRFPQEMILWKLRESRRDFDEKNFVFCLENQVRYGSFDEYSVLGTLESSIKEWSFSQDCNVLCVVTWSSVVEFLKLEL